jgi:hypothetical protein
MQAWHELHGGNRDDVRIARLGMKALAQMNPGTTYYLKDLMPNYDPPEPAPVQTEDEMKGIVRGFFRSVERRIAKGKPNG